VAVIPIAAALPWLPSPLPRYYCTIFWIFSCSRGYYRGITAVAVTMSFSTSYLADELHHPAESEFRRHLHSASSHELSVPFPIRASQPMATEHFQSPLYRSGTVFCSISRLLRHFPSSALSWWHTSSNSITHSYCCHAQEVTLSFMDTLIALT